MHHAFERMLKAGKFLRRNGVYFIRTKERIAVFSSRSEIQIQKKSSATFQTFFAFLRMCGVEQSDV